MAAAVISVAGAVVWSRTVGDDDRTPDAVLDEPGEYAEPGAVTNPPLNLDRLPDVELITPAGVTGPLRIDGRPMVVNLWYSTCPPCARELAAFAAVHDDVGDDVRFVGVNPHDSAEVMGRFAADRGVTYELWRDPGFAFTDDLGVAAFPVTLFVDRDGTLVEQSSGAIDDAELRDRIADLWGVDA